MSFFICTESNELEHAKALFDILLDATDEDLKQSQLKISVSVYTKSFYRNVYNNGMRNMSADTSLIHIQFLFDAISSLALNLKAKFSMVQALEQML